MTGFTKPLPPEVLELVPNAVHIHSYAGFPEHRCQGDQTAEEISESAAACGFDQVFLSNHSTNPQVGEPHAFTSDDSQGRAMLGYLDNIDNSRMPGADVYRGFEVNILGDGNVDTPIQVLEAGRLIIASMHGHVPEVAAEAERLLMSAAANPGVDMIGHFGRYLENVPVNWYRVFVACADVTSPTLVEANFNAMFTYGSMKARRKGDLDEFKRLRSIEMEQYRLLGRSGAHVVVALDVHNALQWPTDEPSEEWQPSHGDIEEFLKVLTSCVPASRIVNRHLVDILDTAKEDRGLLLP